MFVNGKQPTTMREMLDAIEEFAGNPDVALYEKRALWFVLTALRGPDSGDNPNVKARTTAVLRARTLPILARIAQADVAPSHVLPEYSLLEAGVPGHFINHIDYAFAALRGQAW